MGRHRAPEQSPTGIIDSLKPYAKSIYGALTAGLIAFLTALLPYLTSNQGLSEIPAQGWVTALLAGLVAVGGVGSTVYKVKNTTV